MKVQLSGGCDAVETRCIASPCDGERRRPAERACLDCFVPRSDGWRTFQVLPFRQQYTAMQTPQVETRGYENPTFQVVREHGIFELLNL